MMTGDKWGMKVRRGNNMLKVMDLPRVRNLGLKRESRARCHLGPQVRRMRRCATVETGAVANETLW